MRFMKIKENQILSKRSPVERIVFTVVFCVFAVYAVSMIFPLIWLVMSSMKTSTDYALDVMNLKPFALPRSWEGLSNYVQVFEKLKYKDTTYLEMIFNSIWYIVFSVVPHLFCSSLFGYVMAKYKFKGREFIHGLVIFTMTVPIVGTGGAYYVMVNQMGIFNTPLYPLLTNIYCFGHFLYMYAAYKNISWDYAEAVFIDGGNHWTAYFNVMMPQAMPLISTLAITMSISQWNTYEGVLMYLPDYPTVASGLYQASMTLNRSGGATLYYTGLVVSIIPILVLFIVFADKLMKNLSVGGLKG